MNRTREERVAEFHAETHDEAVPDRPGEMESRRSHAEGYEIEAPYGDLFRNPREEKSRGMTWVAVSGER